MNTSLSKSQLTTYVQLQLERFFPDGNSVELLANVVPEALRRLEICINAVKLWPKGQFDHLHSTQYCIFIYLLSRVSYEYHLPRSICNKLFMLNKCLNGIDLFYEIEMPNRFFIGHSVGIVLAKARYGEYLVLYQNSTVGKSNGLVPHLGRGTIVFPNAAILGESCTGEYTTISQGARLINHSTPSNSIVFSSAGNREPIIKPASRRYLEDYFRSD